MLKTSAERALDQIALAQRLDQLAEMLDRLGKHQSDVVELLRSQAVNGVLFSGVVRTDASGLARLDFPIPYAAIAIAGTATQNTWISNYDFDNVASVPNPSLGGHQVGAKVLPGNGGTAPSTGGIFHLVGQHLQIFAQGGTQLYNLTVYSTPTVSPQAV